MFSLIVDEFLVCVRTCLFKFLFWVTIFGQYGHFAPSPHSFAWLRNPLIFLYFTPQFLHTNRISPLSIKTIFGFTSLLDVVGFTANGLPLFKIPLINCCLLIPLIPKRKCFMLLWEIMAMIVIILILSNWTKIK